MQNAKYTMQSVNSPAGGQNSKFFVFVFAFVGILFIGKIALGEQDTNWSQLSGANSGKIREARSDTYPALLAQTISSPSIIKGLSPAVFYYKDGKKWLFPNETVYKSWYADWTQVQTVDQKILDSISLEGNVLIRPGTWLIKTPLKPEVYAVEPQGRLRWIETEEIAKSIYGDNWWQKVREIPEGLRSDYKVDSAIKFAEYPSGSIVRSGSDYYLILSFFKSKIGEDAFRDFGFNREFILGTRLSLDSYNDSERVSDAISVLADITQGKVAEEPAIGLILRKPFLKTASIDSANNQIFYFAARSGNQSVVLSRIVINMKSVNDPKNIIDRNDFDSSGLLHHTAEGVFRGANLKNFRILDAADGRLLFGPSELMPFAEFDGEQDLELSGDLRLLPYETRELVFVVDLPATTPENESYQFILRRKDAQARSAQGILLPVNQVDETGPAITAVKESLKISVLSLTEDTKARDSKDAEIGVFNFQAGKGSDLVVNRIKFDSFVAAGLPEQFSLGIDGATGLTKTSDLINTVKLVDQISGQEFGQTSPRSDGSLFFDNLKIDIKAGIAVTLALKANLKNYKRPDGADVFLSFDITRAENDIGAVSFDGQSISASPDKPNNGGNPSVYFRIVPNGTLTISGGGSRGGYLPAGQKDVSFSTVHLKAEYEDFEIKSVSFKNIAGNDRAISGVKLRYTDKDKRQVTQSGELKSGRVTFNNISSYVKTGREGAYLSLLVDINPAYGIESGDRIGFIFDKDNLFQAKSQLTNAWVNESDLGKPYFINQTTPSATSVIVRKTLLAFSLNQASPRSGYRGLGEIMRFNVFSEGEVTALIKKLIFEITTTDAGASGAMNDLLEFWADKTRGFYEADDLVNLYETDIPPFSPLGEGGSGSITLQIIDGLTGVPYANLNNYESKQKDYARFIYALTPALNIGTSSRVFSFDVDASGFRRGQVLRARLLGEQDFIWQDDWRGSELYGSEITSLPIFGYSVSF